MEIGNAQETINTVFNLHFSIIILQRKGNTMARQRSTLIAAMCAIEAEQDSVARPWRRNRSFNFVLQSLKNVILPRIVNQRGSHATVTIKSAIAKLTGR